MLADFKSKLDKTIEALRTDLNGVRAGRASAGLVENLSVESYGATMTVKQVANITVPDSQSLAIQPWDRANLAGIEKAIQQSNLGLNPVNDGIMIRVNIPPLSAERRDELSKLVRQIGEEAKISVRSLRHDMLSKVSSQVKNKEIGEDDQARLEKQIQEEVDKINATIDEILSEKEKEIKTV